MQNLRFEISNLKFKIQNSGAGFTLLELIVVVFIISMVLAVSLPSFTGVGESKVKSDAKRIASILRYQNDSAISAKETFSMKVDFSRASTGSALLIYNGPDGEKAEVFKDISGVELQSRGMVSEGEVVIFFGPSGASENIKVYLGDDKNLWTVALNSMSGRVKITQNAK
ncbi:MAG: prepilin-type N-terminal cleavage/methylation domain-containing protein [Thermodesulfovibrionales bacterium]